MDKISYGARLKIASENKTIAQTGSYKGPDGREVKLTAREYAILKVLLENKGVIISREKLMDIVWGYNSGTDERVLDTHMRNLRKALGTNGKIIKTVIRRGYKAEDI